MYYFIILLHVLSSFLLPRSLLIPYKYVFIKAINCILLSAFEFQAILLIFPVKSLCLSLLKLFLVFNISLMFFYQFFMIFLRLSTLVSFFSRWFILVLSWVDSKQFLWFSNLNFIFMRGFFLTFAFLSSLLSSISNYTFLLLIL